MTDYRPYGSDFDDYPSEKYPPDWNARRKKVLSRDGYRCQVCGVSSTRVDSIQFDIDLPKSEGGSHSLSNLQTLCRSCHAEKYPENTHLAARAREWEQRNSNKRPLWQRILQVLFVLPMLFSLLGSGRSRTVIDELGREIELTALESVPHVPSDRAISVDVRVATLWDDPPESIQQYGLLAPSDSDRSDDVELRRFVVWADNYHTTMEKNATYRLIGAITNEYKGDMQLKLDRKSEILPLDH